MNSSLAHQEDRQAIGTIVEVHGPVVIIDCTQLPPLRQALCTCFDHTTYMFEVHQHLDERHIRAITLHGTAGLSRGMIVFDTGAPLQIPVSEQCLGRLLNIFGEPLDGLPAFGAKRIPQYSCETAAVIRSHRHERDFGDGY